MRISYYKILCLLVLIVFNSCLLMAEITITIDASREFQTIDNFGASDCWSMQKIGAWFTIVKEHVADLLFSVEDGIGLSAWRFNIGGGINTTTISHPWRTVETFETGQGQYDWTRQEEERWFLQAAKERGVDQFIGFVNSPTRRMTRNGFTNCSNGLGSTNLKEGWEDQFATYLADILKHFRDEWDIDFDYISPVNEPQWEWNNSNQEGNRASNEDIIAIVSVLYDELQSQDLNTEISIVESGNLQSWYREIGELESEYGEKYGDYLHNVISNDDIETKIARHLGGHSYWSDRLNNHLVQDRQALYLKIMPYLLNGWKYWMTEYCILDGPYGNGGHGRDLTINTALNVARVIHYDLTILHASAWQWWTAVSPEDYKDGFIYTDYMDNPNSQSVIESKLLWALGNYSRYIRPGSKRIKLTGADETCLGSAYLSPNRDKLIIVMVNVSESQKQISFEISGLSNNDSISSFTPYVTSDNPEDDLKEYPSFSIDSGYEAPARSIVTLVGDIGDSSDLEFFQGSIPNDYKLFQNFPNPFNSETQIYYYLPEPRKIQISIFSQTGELIKTIVKNEQGFGFHSIKWDGRNNSEEIVSSGVYLYTMQAGSNKEFKKMVYIQ